MTNVFRLLGLLGIVALALSIYGGIIVDVPSDQSKSNTFRHIGSVLFAVLYGLLAAAHAVCWLHATTLMKHRRTVCFSKAYLHHLALLTQFSHSCLSVSRWPYRSSASVWYTLSSPAFLARP